MPSNLPMKRRVQWRLVLTLAILFAVAAFVVTSLTTYSSIRVVSDEIGELTLIAFGVPLYQERGPGQALVQKASTYGSTLVAGCTAAGMLLGAAVGTAFVGLSQRADFSNRSSSQT